MSAEGIRPEPRAVGNMFGREDAIRSGRCSVCPVQYTREQISMWPDADQTEYATSGLCRACQARVFGASTECTCDDPCCSVDVGVGVVTCRWQHCPIHGEGTEHAEAARQYRIRLAEGHLSECAILTGYPELGCTCRDSSPAWTI